MKIAARRRLALGVLGTSSALIAGVLIVPAVAAPNGLIITPAGALNTDTAAELTFETTEADLNFGADAVFTRIDGGLPFTVTISSNSPLFTLGPDREKSRTVNFTDMGSGLGNDGPADAGTYNVSVTGRGSPGGTGIPSEGGGNDTCTSCFTVLPGGDVTVSSVAPTSLRPGQSGNVSVLGNNFERGTRIDVLLPGGFDPDTGINANMAPIDEDGEVVENGITTRTELKRRFAVISSATPGVRDVRITNLDGSTALCSRCFFVAGAELTGVNPTFGVNDPTSSPVAVTFTGTEVVNGTPRLDFLGNPGATPRSELAIEGSNPRNFTGTSITADFDLANAAPGNYQPVVEGANGVINACRPGCIFSVAQQDARMPTLTSLDRSTLVGVQKNLAQGETKTFVATGTNFSRGATLDFDPPEGLTVTAAEFVTPERLDVTIAAGPDAEAGDKDVTVRLTDGKTSEPCVACLTVTSGSGASPSPSGSASPAPGNESFAFDRLAGNDRYATAATIATSSFDTAATVLLANGQSDDPRTTRNESHFPDALAGAYLAGFRQAPTLLATEDALPQPTREALRALRTENVVIIGGLSAISQSVENELKESFTVTRVAGADRFETARRVAETPPVSYIGQNPAGDATAVVASGERFPDALVAGPLGYNAKFPVLTTAGEALSDQTRQALQNLGVDHVLIPGGIAAVSQETEEQIRALGITTERFAGQGRTETATMVAAYAYDELGFDRAHVDLARGNDFPDALAGGPHAGVQQAPILLTATPDDISAATEAFLRNRGSQLQEGEIFGGLSAVSQRAEDQAEAAVREGNAGGGEASPEPSDSASPEPSDSASPEPSDSASPEPSGSASPSADASGSPSASGSPEPSPSCTPGLLRECPSPEPSGSASPEPSGSMSPSATASP